MLPKKILIKDKHFWSDKGLMKLLGTFVCLFILLGSLSPVQAKKTTQLDSKSKSISYAEDEKTEDVPTSMRVGLFTLTGDSSLIKHCGSARVCMESTNVVNLSKGETLIFSSKPTIVKVGSFVINIAPAAIVLVSNQGDIVKVRNLCEKTSLSVVVSFNGKQTALAAGQEVMLGTNTDAIKKAMNAEPIGRRQMHAVEFTHGPSIMKCEVSLLSLIQNVDVLNKLMLSKNKEDRDIARRLMKMAAVISQVSAGHGAYTTVGF